MAGIVSPSMPMWLVSCGSARSCCSINEGLGKVLRFGANGSDVLNRLRWIRNTLAPTLDAALRRLSTAGKSPDVFAILKRSLEMGDDAVDHATDRLV